MLNKHDRQAKRTNYYRLLLPPLIIVLLIYFSFLPRRSSSYVEPDAPEKISRQYPIMGTMAWITLYGKKELTSKAADAVYDEFKKVEEVCNIFNEKSEISRLNRTAAIKPFTCSDTLWEVLVAAKKGYEISDGAFDITAKPLMDLWGFYRKQEALPAPDKIKEALTKVGLDKVIFNPQNKSIKFTIPGIKFDLGGIAKGYAVDRAAAAVKTLGIQSGIINLGGNIYCFPQPPPGKKKYTIGIKDPKKPENIIKKIELLDQSVATSGNYERYVIINGKQYTHIMNPQTGLPVEQMLSVTVITPQAVNADIYSTAIFIKGSELADKICSQHPATNVIIFFSGKNNSVQSFTSGNIF